MRKKVRFLLAGLLVADVLLIGYLMYDYIQNKIPDSVLTYVGEKQELDLPAFFKTEQSVPALHVQNQGGSFSMKSNRLGSYEVSVRLFGVLPVKRMDVKVVKRKKIFPSGEPIGIYVETNGLLVLDTTEVPAKDGLTYAPGENLLKPGDYILEWNQKKLTTEENAAVKKRALTSGSYNGENTDCVAGGQVDNAVFWPLSTAEAFAVNNDLRALDPAHPNWVTSSWWLRSPGSKTFYVAIVSSDGSVQYSGISIRKQNNHLTVRPAFNLNLNSVLFTSAAVGGKPDGGLTEVPEYSGNEWKLTLLDSSRNFAVTEKLSAPTPTIPLR